MAYGDKQNIMRDWLKSQGVVFSEGGEYRPLIVACIGETATIFPDLFDRLADCYIYDQGEQQYADGKKNDAVMWYHTPPNESTMYAIGISIAAAAEGESYLLLCILHELAHVENVIDCGKSDHTSRFHHCLNDLIEKFNKATGRSIENDLDGLQMRYDSRAWTLPENIPQESRKKGQEFRHG